MNITCRKCATEYDYEEHAEQCPYCGSINQVFRSKSAQTSMGSIVEEQGQYKGEKKEPERYSRHYKAMQKEMGNPYTVSPRRGALGKLKPYLLIVLLAAGVVLLGTFLMQTSRRANAQSAASSMAEQLPRLPIAEYASVSFNKLFEPVEDVSLQVNYTGVLDDTVIPGLKMPSDQKLIFVDMSAWAITTAAREKAAMPGAMFLRMGENGAPMERYLVGEHPEAAFTAVKPFDPALMSQGMAEGQLYFAVPKDTTSFYLCWLDDVTNTEQRMELRV